MWLELFACVVMLLHLLICPFTKVEESFNIQAIHDVINLGTDIKGYDHLEFPGVVPRTFLGPIVIGALSKPFTLMSDHLGFDKFAQQYIVRAVLGFATIFSFFTFCKAVETKFGSCVKKVLILISVSQFHFMFYASRPLPNVFALCLVLLALSCWLHDKYATFVWLAGASIIIFRFDLVMFFSFIALHDLWHRRIRFLPFLLTAVITGIFLLGLTVGVDSWFWGRLLWPEGEVMLFNVILNKSHEYGTLPFLWYFYSALPRALSASLVLVPLGIYVNRPVMRLVGPALGYVFLFSFLPHKELRFIIYTIPVFNTAAACALSYIWRGRNKSLLRTLMALAGVGTLIMNMATTSVFLYISSYNYPGGVAMRILHSKYSDRYSANVHIDVFAAQTGVTRFTQSNPTWSYSKEENLHESEFPRFDYRLVGEDSYKASKRRILHRPVAFISAFDRLSLDLNSFPPLQIVLKEKCSILSRVRKQRLEM